MKGLCQTMKMLSCKGPSHESVPPTLRLLCNIPKLQRLLEMPLVWHIELIWITIILENCMGEVIALWQWQQTTNMSERWPPQEQWPPSQYSNWMLKIGLTPLPPSSRREGQDMGKGQQEHVRFASQSNNHGLWLIHSFSQEGRSWWGWQNQCKLKAKTMRCGSSCTNCTIAKRKSIHTFPNR